MKLTSQEGSLNGNQLTFRVKASVGAALTSCLNSYLLLKQMTDAQDEDLSP